MIDAMKVSTAELSTFRYCPNLYYLNQRDSDFKRFKEFNTYYEAIGRAVSGMIKMVFIHNKEPKEKAFLNNVLTIFNRLAVRSEEEWFLSGIAIDRMLTLASKIFQHLQDVFNSVILHPIKYELFLGRGEIILEGAAYPIIRYDNQPSIFLIDTFPTITRQTQYMDVNLAAFRLWVHDNFTDVRNFVYYNMKNISKGPAVIPINFSDVDLVLDYLTNLAIAIKSHTIYPTNPENCETCTGGCVDYLIKEA